MMDVAVLLAACVAAKMPLLAFLTRLKRGPYS